MKQKIITIIAILSIVFGAGYALAFQGMCPKAGKAGGYGGGQGGCATEQIPNLTEEQKTAINTLRDTFINDSKPIHEEIRAKHLELKTLFQADPLDKNAIDAKQDDIMALKEKLEKISLTFRVGMADLLTPEQRKVAGPGACPMGEGCFGDCPGRGNPHGNHKMGMGGKSKCPALQPES